MIPGAFGRVFIGQVKNNPDSDADDGIAVAVKTLKREINAKPDVTTQRFVSYDVQHASYIKLKMLLCYALLSLEHSHVLAGSWLLGGD